ncbi:hypothetical protein OF83DRAFT_1109635 [Amylostereum chailletii]|nr:hypothetical protein OF83DRAFT_1109635 [Amylostereum chailletii]
MAVQPVSDSVRGLESTIEGRHAINSHILALNSAGGAVEPSSVDQKQLHGCNDLHVEFGILGRQLQQMEYVHTMQMNALSQLLITSRVNPPMLAVPWAPTYPYTAQLPTDSPNPTASGLSYPATPSQPIHPPSRPSHLQTVASSTAMAASSRVPPKTRVLELGADENVEFEASDLSRLDVPTISLADRLDSLFTEWYTGNTAYVSVKGKPVPICQWYKLYQKREGCERGKVWRSNGQQWGQWKVK